MKKRFLLLLSSITLLTACDNNKPNDSSTSSEDNSSSSNVISSESSSSEGRNDELLLDNLGKKLISLEGNIVSSKTKMIRQLSYASDGDFSLYVENNYVTTRYKKDDSYVKETIGTEKIEDETSSYKTQTFDNGKKFYRINEYDEDATTRSQKSEKYSASNVDSIYDVGQAYTEIANFQYMLTAGDKTDDTHVVEYQFENIEGVEIDGKLSYSYSLSIYEIDTSSSKEEKTLSQRMTYENVFTIKNNLITHLSQKYLMDTYAGEAKQSILVNLEEDYTQGEFQTFSGELYIIGRDSQ